MAAVLQPSTLHHRTFPSAASQDRPGDRTARPRARHLRAVPAPVARPASRRTYLWRRLLALAVAGVALVAVAVGTGALVGGVADVAAGGPADTRVVRPGDTVWSIATDLDPGADPRDTVARIIEMNSDGPDPLGPSAAVTPGQVIRVPGGG